MGYTKKHSFQVALKDSVRGGFYSLHWKLKGLLAYCLVVILAPACCKLHYDKDNRRQAARHPVHFLLPATGALICRGSHPLCHNGMKASEKRRGHYIELLKNGINCYGKYNTIRISYQQTVRIWRSTLGNTVIRLRRSEWGIWSFSS